MHRLFMPFLVSTITLTTGCSKLFVDVTGSVDGNKLGAGTAYWGGPVLLITDADMACEDLSWVSYSKSGNSYQDGEDLGNGETFNALQFTYESSALQDGKLSIQGMPPSPAFGYFLATENGIASMYKAASGSIEIETDKKDRVSGNFELSFGDDGTLSGDFMIENCVNLKERHN